MASKLKNRQRAVQLEQSNVKSSETSLQTDRRTSTGKEDGDEFPAAPNIAAKIAQRRLPRRTPTSHVKGVGGDLIRRRLSKTNDGEQGSSRPNRFTYGSSFENSFDESEEKKMPEEPPKPSKLPEEVVQPQSNPATNDEKPQ